MGYTNGVDIIIRLTENADTNFEGVKCIFQSMAENDQAFLLLTSSSDRVIELKKEYGEGIVIEDLALCINEQTRKGKDILVLDAGILLMSDGLGKLGHLMQRRPDLGTLSPIFTEYQQLPCDLQGLERYIEVENQTGGCVYIKSSAVTPFFDTLRFSDFTTSGLPFVFNRISQLGFRHAITDEVAAYSKHILDQNGVSIDSRKNLKLQQILRNGKRNLLYVAQADFREDASNNIGGTQLHVKDLVFDNRDMFNIFVAARNREFIQVTAYLSDERITFRYYAGLPSRYPAQHNNEESKIFENILAGFRIHLIHIHHTYSMSNEIYKLADSMGIPTLLTLHDFYSLCPTIKMFNYENTCCIGKDNSDMCKICLQKMMGIDTSINYIEEWRQQNKRLLSGCNQLIVPSENAKNVFQTYNSEITSKIQVIEHGYDAISIEHNLQSAEIVVHENFSYNMEKVDENRGYCIAIEGWACLYDKDNNAMRIFLEATDSFGKCILIPTYKYEREDVACGDQRYLKTGFHAHIPRKQLADGAIKLRPVIVDNNVFYSCERYEEIHYQSDPLNRLNIAFIGGLSLAKGSNEIYKIITQGPKDVNWFIFGGIGDEQLTKLKRKNLAKTNFYQRDELQYYLDLHRIDVICILSLWPETFCYTLSEAIAYRRPVIVTEVGALGERTKAMNCGWTVPLEHIDTHVLEIINQIKDKGVKLQEKKEVVNKAIWKSLHEMNKEYREIYSKWINMAENNIEYDSRFFYSAWLQAQPNIENSRSADVNCINFENYIAQLETEIRGIKGSRSYHLATIISKMWNKLKIKRG